MKNLLFLLCFVGIIFFNPIKVTAQKINCNEEPSKNLTQWPVIENQKDGVIIFSAQSIKLTQKTDKIKYQEVLEKIGNGGLNACVLSYLLDNPNLIPNEWKNYKVIFSGTTYVDSGQNKFNLYLYFWDNNWDIGSAYISEYLYPDMRIALK